MHGKLKVRLSRTLISCRLNLIAEKERSCFKSWKLSNLDKYMGWQYFLQHIDGTKVICCWSAYCKKYFCNKNIEKEFVFFGKFVRSLKIQRSQPEVRNKHIINMLDAHAHVLANTFMNFLIQQCHHVLPIQFYQSTNKLQTTNLERWHVAFWKWNNKAS